jgi:hypothetical protein
LYKSGEWEPVVPASVLEIEKQMNQMGVRQSRDEDDVEQQEGVFDEVEVYENIPMIDDYDELELDRMVMDEVGEESNPRMEVDIILRRHG